MVFLGFCFQWSAGGYLIHLVEFRERVFSFEKFHTNRLLSISKPSTDQVSRPISQAVLLGRGERFGVSCFPQLC